MRENRTYSSEGGDGVSRFRPLSRCRALDWERFLGRGHAADYRCAANPPYELTVGGRAVAGRGSRREAMEKEEKRL